MKEPIRLKAVKHISHPKRRSTDFEDEIPQTIRVAEPVRLVAESVVEVDFRKDNVVNDSLTIEDVEAELIASGDMVVSDGITDHSNSLRKRFAAEEWREAIVSAELYIAKRLGKSHWSNPEFIKEGVSKTLGYFLEGNRRLNLHRFTLAEALRFQAYWVCINLMKKEGVIRNHEISLEEQTHQQIPGESNLHHNPEDVTAYYQKNHEIDALLTNAHDPEISELWAVMSEHNLTFSEAKEIQEITGWPYAKITRAKTKLQRYLKKVSE